MITVQGMHGRRVFVLGMGRSGLVAAQALEAGGADVLCWDDGEAGRQRAQEAGLNCSDPLRGGLEGVDMLITSPGIAHLYPKPHPAIGMAMQLRPASSARCRPVSPSSQHNTSAPPATKACAATRPERPIPSTKTRRPCIP